MYANTCGERAKRVARSASERVRRVAHVGRVQYPPGRQSSPRTTKRRRHGLCRHRRHRRNGQCERRKRHRRRRHRRKQPRRHHQRKSRQPRQRNRLPERIPRTRTRLLLRLGLGLRLRLLLLLLLYHRRLYRCLYFSFHRGTPPSPKWQSPPPRENALAPRRTPSPRHHAPTRATNRTYVYHTSRIPTNATDQARVRPMRRDAMQIRHDCAE